MRLSPMVIGSATYENQSISEKVKYKMGVGVHSKQVAKIFNKVCETLPASEEM